MRISVRHIQETVAEHFEVPVSIMISDKRYDPRSTQHLPRQTAMFFARELTGKSYKNIATLFHRKDHTTTRHAVQKVAGLAAKDRDFKGHLETLRGRLVSTHPQVPQVQSDLPTSSAFSRAA